MDKQLQNDLSLLEQMMIELERAADLYKPTNYWSVYESRILPELKKYGLNNYRRRRRSVLGSFGATDLRVKGALTITKKTRIRCRIERFLNVLIDALPFVSLDVDGVISSELTEYFYWKTKEKSERAGYDLSACPTSYFGNPDDLQEIEGKLWSLKHLQYCSMYIDAAEHIKVDNCSVVCELAGGMGRNVEVMAQLHPKATFIYYDIPPQLYVANQYLSQVFGDRVIQYREAVRLVPDNEAIPDIARGKIIILPTWKLPSWSNAKVDVFWSSASFQEMEPDVVINYLELVKKMRPDWIYINALPEGNYWGDWKKGQGGTKAPVLEKYYFQALDKSHSLKCSYYTDYFLRRNKYKSYIFQSISS